MVGENVTKEEIIERLNTLPEAIKNQEINILKIQDEINNLESSLNYAEARIKRRVMDETEDGKPKYTNETQRKMAIDLRTQDDGEHKNLRVQMANKTKEISEAKIGLESMQNKFKAARSMTLLFGNE